MSSTITQTLSRHRESVTSALIEGRSARLQPLQDEILAAISGDPNEQRARREIDRLPERLLFGWMSALRHRGGQSPLDEATLISRCREVIGDDKIWLPQYREASSNDRARLVVVLTWQCETRCTYCSIPKQSGREMSHDVLNSAIELLSSADKPKLELRFFGGEPMMEWAAIQAGIDQYNKEGSASRAQCVQKYVILDTDFSVPGGELTGTQKLKKNVVLEKFASQIESMYV